MLNSSDSNLILKEMSQKFPMHQWYRFFNRFFMHGQHHFSGWLPGEREEPGFTVGAMTALLFELNHLDEPLTKEVIEHIHSTVIDGVLNTNYSPWAIRDNQVTYRQPGEYVGFGLIPGSNLSPQGLKELQNECPHEQFGYELQKSQIGETGRFFYKLACLSDHSEDRVSYALEAYHEKLDSVLSNDPEDIEVLNILCRLVTDLERLHPYGDGNCRTFGIIVLNRELVRLGFPPTLMDDPNQFDGYSQQELVSKIQEGQKRYRELLDEHQLTETPYRSAVIEDKASGKVIDRKSLSDYDLTQLDALSFSEPLEFIDGHAYQGQEQESFEFLFARMITESAIQNAYAKEPSLITGNLMARLNQMEEEYKALSNKALEVNLEHFYHNSLSDVLSALNFDVRLSLFKGAFNFGASSAVYYLDQVLKRCPEELSEYRINMHEKQKQYELTLLGTCLVKGRYQLVEKMLSLLPRRQLEVAMSQDLMTLLDNKKWQDINHAFLLVRDSNVFDSQKHIKSMAHACAKSHDHYSKHIDDTQIFDSMLKLFHIKSEPLPLLELLLSSFCTSFAKQPMTKQEAERRIEALPKDIRRTFYEFLKGGASNKPSQI